MLIIFSSFSSIKGFSQLVPPPALASLPFLATIPYQPTPRPIFRLFLCLCFPAYVLLVKLYSCNSKWYNRNAAVSWLQFMLVLNKHSTLVFFIFVSIPHFPVSPVSCCATQLDYGKCRNQCTCQKGCSSLFSPTTVGTDPRMKWLNWKQDKTFPVGLVKTEMQL